MRYAGPTLAIAGLMMCFVSATAQTPGTDAVKLRPLSAAGGQGVSNALLLDREGIRVFRVDLEPGGRRNVHAHDDVEWHIFMPVAGTAQLEVETEPVRALAAWQPHLMTAGVRHGFTNKESSTLSVIEIFVPRRR